MIAFLTLALDVPRRLARTKVLWALVVLIGVLLVTGAASFGFGHGDKGEFITFFGTDFITPAQVPDVATFRYEQATAWLTLVFAKGLASYMGVFAGLLLLADAIPSAFAPGAAEVVLTKPVHRGTLVIARHVGALLVAFGLATLLVGGAVAIVYVRTGVFAYPVLVAIPLTVVQVAVLLAIGSIPALVFQNPYLGAVGSVFVWGTGWLTQLVAGFSNALGVAPGSDMPINYKASFAEFVVRTARIAHRAMPRASDIPELIERIPTRNFGTLPGGIAFEVELVVQVLVWTGIALGIATLVVRNRDY